MKSSSPIRIALGLLVIPGCVAAQSLTQTFAGCEANAYVSIGVQTDNSASLEYLEQKNELVRVCMLQHGYSFKSSVPKEAWMDISANAYKRHGVAGTPMYQIPKDVQAAIDREIRRQRALLMLRSSHWVK